MENSYRSKARIVAIIDLILTSMSLLIPVILLIGASAGSYIAAHPDELKNELQAENTENYNVPDTDELKGAATVLWFEFVITLVIVVIQFVAAIKLLNATQIGQDSMKAAQLARFWRGVTIVFTIFIFINIIHRLNQSVSQANPISLSFAMISIFLRCVAIYIVMQFIAEAEMTLPVINVNIRPVILARAYAHQPEGVATMPPKYDELVNEKD